jgi:hypothetical protein
MVIDGQSWYVGSLGEMIDFTNFQLQNGPMATESGLV